MRIGDEEKFELYFVFNSENIKVPRSLINSCLFEYDEAKLSEVLEEIQKEGKIIYFLEEGMSLLDNIGYKRLILFVSVLIGVLHKFRDRDPDLIETVVCLSYINKLHYYRVASGFKSEELSYAFICYMLERTDKFGLHRIVYIINKIEGAYGRLEGYSENKENQMIALEQLKELENSYVEKIRTIVKVESILEIIEFQMVFNLWHFLDKEGATEYWRAIVKDEIKTLKLLCRSTEKFYRDTVNICWNFKLTDYACRISANELYNIIQSFDKRELDNFTETEQIQLASFYLGYSKSDVGNITEEEAKKLLNEWKTAQ